MHYKTVTEDIVPYGKSHTRNFLWNLVSAMNHYVAVKNCNSGRLNMKTCLWYVHWKKTTQNGTWGLIAAMQNYLCLWTRTESYRQRWKLHEGDGITNLLFFSKNFVCCSPVFSSEGKKNLVTKISISLEELPRVFLSDKENCVIYCVFPVPLGGPED